MSYEHEDTEWRSAVGELTELERVAARNEPRPSLGLCGDKGDALYD